MAADDGAEAARAHRFDAVAFLENFALRALDLAFPGGRTTPHELRAPWAGGELFLYPFGAVTFCDVPDKADRDRALERLRAARPGLTRQRVAESFTVRELVAGDPSQHSRLCGGVLHLAELTRARAGVVALIVAQSAATETYEEAVEELFTRTSQLVDGLERRGTVSLVTRRLHRFIGEALGTRNEVISVLHLLDKPDATWDDPEMDRIYDDLRAEFDLKDRYDALERKLSSVQESLELLLDVARDRRMLLLEASVVLLIVLELLLSLLRR
jgi:uncharacterized Rmd1/YagE family protein